MAHIDVSRVGVVLSDGRMLLDDASFRVAEGSVTALVGANGTGKSTLLRIIAGDQQPTEGAVSRSGTLGVMRQLVGTARGQSVRSLLLSVAPEPIRQAARRVDESEAAMLASDDERRQLAYAEALTGWGDVGGYEQEVLWDVCATAALGAGLDDVAELDASVLSGGEQKRLVLEALLRGPDELLLLDEPDNYLDVPGKEWLEAQLAASRKAVLLVSHDRELMARAANRIVTLEGRTAWTHGGGFADYAAAREARIERMAEDHRRWDEERERLRQLVFTLRQQAAISPDMASRYSAMQTRFRKFEDLGPPPELPRRQRIAMRLGGGRTGVRAVTCERLELTALMKPFDLELFYGDRVAVLGGNGSGKSHFLRLLAQLRAGGEGTVTVAHTGRARLGARVVPGHFSQTHLHPEWASSSVAEVVQREAGIPLGPAMSVLTRYELAGQADQTFATLSGGQQARLQILLLDLAGTTLLLLDEPTDNLDVDSAEALESALAAYDGAVVAVTHDRWFARGFDRFVVFQSDGRVVEHPQPVWHEDRPGRNRAAYGATGEMRAT